MAEAIRAIPGVARVETYRALPGQEYQGVRITAVAVSPGFIDSDLFRHQIVAGDPEDSIRAIAAHEGVVISDNLADRFGLRPGETISLPTPSGLETFKIRAVVAADYSGDQGSIILPRDEFARLWQAMTLDKKARGNSVNFILPSRLGSVERVDNVPAAAVEAAGSASCARTPRLRAIRLSRSARGGPRAPGLAATAG